MKKVIIEIEIEEMHDDHDSEYTFLEERGVKVRGENLSTQDLHNLAEGWAQSDWFYVDFTADVLDAM